MVGAAHTAMTSSVPDAAREPKHAVQTRPTLTHLKGNGQEGCRDTVSEWLTNVLSFHFCKVNTACTEFIAWLASEVDTSLEGDVGLLVCLLLCSRLKCLYSLWWITVKCSFRDVHGPQRKKATTFGHPDFSTSASSRSVGSVFNSVQAFMLTSGLIVITLAETFTSGHHQDKAPAELTFPSFSALLCV